MSQFNGNTVYVDDVGIQSYLIKVFTKMGVGLLITAAVALAVSLSNLTYLIGSNILVYLVIVAAQLGICFAISRNLMTMQPGTTNILFYVYSALTGLTFSVLVQGYGLGTVFGAFAFTAVMFFSCVVIGKTTSVDLSKFSTLIYGGLVALIIATVISLFVPVLRNSLLISYAGIIIFLALTAYDVQKIKSYYYGTDGGYGVAGENLATYGAFQLYLDFINIFLYILRILGRRKN